MEENKIAWMVEQAKSDEMNLSEDEILIILATGGGVGIYSDSEVDYVHELETEYDQSDRSSVHLHGNDQG